MYVENSYVTIMSVKHATKIPFSVQHLCIYVQNKYVPNYRVRI